MAQMEFILVAVTTVLAGAWLVSRFVLARPASRDLLWRTALVAVALLPALALVRGELVEWQWPLAILPAVEARDARTQSESVLSQAPLDHSLTANPALTPTRPISPAETSGS